MNHFAKRKNFAFWKSGPRRPRSPRLTPKIFNHKLITAIFAAHCKLITILFYENAICNDAKIQTAIIHQLRSGHPEGGRATLTANGHVIGTPLAPLHIQFWGRSAVINIENSAV